MHYILLELHVTEPGGEKHVNVTPVDDAPWALVMWNK